MIRTSRRRVWPGRWLVILLLLALAGCQTGHLTLRPETPAAPPPLVIPPAPDADSLRTLLAQPEPIRIGGVPLTEVASLRAFYAARDYRSVFTGADCLRRLPELRAALALAEAHGLRAEDYHAGALSAEDCALTLELPAADAWLALARHLHAGRIDPHQVEPDWTASRPPLDAAAQLAQALAGEGLVTVLEALAPRDAYYLALQRALPIWRERAARGDWPQIDDGTTLKPGAQGLRVRQLRERLAAEGFAAEAVENPEVYDAGLEAQLRRFQTLAHLDVDGAVGKETLAELRRSPAERVMQLRVNLERWRWLPDQLGERHLRVNIADFRLEARAGGRVERVHRIIVGKQLRRTPSFSASMSYLVVNPWWEVPRRLAVEDKLPLFRKDPSAVQRLGFRVLDGSGADVDPAGIDWNALSKQHFPYRLRQSPGPQNALGRIKLMFPNRHDVYLHDTPTRGLFERSRRNFSSGCVRVEAPLELAAWVLGESSGVSVERLAAIVDSGEETMLRLLHPLPVHLQYLTAVVADGEVRFVHDLYGRDLPLAALLGP